MASKKSNRCTKCGVHSSLHLRLKPQAQAFARLDDKFICETCYQDLARIWDELWFMQTVGTTQVGKSVRKMFATYPKAIRDSKPTTEPVGGTYIKRGRKNSKSVYPNLPTFYKPEVKKSKSTKKSKAA